MFNRFGVLALSAIGLGLAAMAQEPSAGWSDPSYRAADAAPQLIVFSQRGYGGDVREIYDVVPTLREAYFNDRPRSLAVLGGVWEVCEDADFTGRCAIIREDVYDLRRLDLDRRITSIRPIYEYTDAPHALLFERDRLGRIRYAEDYAYADYGYTERHVRTDVYVHYGFTPDYRRYGYYDPRFGHGPYGYGYGRPNYGHGHHGYRSSPPPLKGHYGAKNGAVTIYTDSREGGASLGLNRAVPDLSRYRFNDNASSITIREGQWEVCEHANYQGRCQVIDMSKDKLNAYRLNDNISSIRPVEGTRPPQTGHQGRGSRDGHRGAPDSSRDRRNDDALAGGRDMVSGQRGLRDEAYRGVRRTQPVEQPRRAILPRATPNEVRRDATAPPVTMTAPRVDPRRAAPVPTIRPAPDAAPVRSIPQRAVSAPPPPVTRSALPAPPPQAAPQPRRPGGLAARPRAEPSTATQRPGRSSMNDVPRDRD